MRPRELPPDRREEPTPEPVLPPSPSRPVAHALLVEDQRIVGDLLAEFLALEGYAVDRAMNGREAIELVGRQTYAIIVSDIRMPEVDGPALYYELLSTRPALTRRMVFVTGDIVSPETRRFLDETCLRYLEKPFTLDALQTVLRGMREEVSLS